MCLRFVFSCSVMEEIPARGRKCHENMDVLMGRHYKIRTSEPLRAHEVNSKGNGQTSHCILLGHTITKHKKRAEINKKDLNLKRKGRSTVIHICHNIRGSPPMDTGRSAYVSKDSLEFPPRASTCGSSSCKVLRAGHFRAGHFNSCKVIFLVKTEA